MGKRVSTKVSDQVSGGFLDDVDVKVVGGHYERSSFEGDEGMVTKTQAVVLFAIEDKEDPIQIFYSVGDALVPCDEDGNEEDTGQWLCAREGKESKGVHKNSAWGKFLAALVGKCKFPDGHIDKYGLAKGLTGLEGHTVSEAGGVFKKDGVVKEGRPFPVFAKIDKKTIFDGKKGPKPISVESVRKKKSEEEGEDEGTSKKVVKKSKKKDEDESDDLEQRVAEVIAKETKKKALPKGQLAQRVGKAFDGEDEKGEAVKLSMQSAFLKQGAEEGLWSYDGRLVGPVEEEEEVEEEEDEKPVKKSSKKTSKKVEEEDDDEDSDDDEGDEDEE